MSMQNNIPTYAGLFGDIDFKEGDEYRSVYSPAAYLADLLQLLDDEFLDTFSYLDEEGNEALKLEFDARRDDIKHIGLDEENTTTLIPYLDIVNELLESAVADTEDAVYSTLDKAVYPFNMSFSYDNEKIKNHLKHLGISAHELRALFAEKTSPTESINNYTTVAREYLGLSVNELSDSVEPDSVSLSNTADAYGYDASTLIADMSKIPQFMASTDLDASAVRELLHQNLYIDPADHTQVEAGRDSFYINTGLTTDTNSTYAMGYVTLDDSETTLLWQSLIDGAADESQVIPVAWFNRVSRFFRLSQKTGLSFTQLDQVLRNCCLVDGVPTINAVTLQHIAQVVYLHKSLELPLDTVIAFVASISVVGRSNEDYPQDKFNQVFNLPCVKVDKKFLYIDGITGDIPAQYADTTYHDYSAIRYAADLFSDNNDDYRKRLRHTLGFTETDLINIVDRLSHEGVVGSAFWESTSYEWDLLNVLYRIHTLSLSFDVHFLELFTLLDIIAQDPFIGRLDPNSYFIFNAPSTQNGFEILCKTRPASNEDREENLADRLWLFESLHVLTQWMKTFGYSAELLWKIANGAPQTDAEEEQQNQKNLGLYNRLLSALEENTLSKDAFKAELSDERSVEFAYRQFNKVCHSGYYDKGEGGKGFAHSHSHLLTYDKDNQAMLGKQFLDQLDVVFPNEFMGLTLETKLLDKLYENLLIHQITDAEGEILFKTLPELDDFSIETNFSEVSIEVYGIIHRIYMEAMNSRLNEDDPIEVQVLSSDLESLLLAGKPINSRQLKELYSNLMYNNIVDEQGYVQAGEYYSEKDGDLLLNTNLSELTQKVYQVIKTQWEKFHASEVMVSPSLFDDVELDQQSQDDLISNLQINGYLDEKNRIVDKMRILDETPESMALALAFYPERKAIHRALISAITTDRTDHLSIDVDNLKPLTQEMVSRWVFEDLQSQYTEIASDGYGSRLTPNSKALFLDDDNKVSFTLSDYFDDSQCAIVFDHLKALVEYTNSFVLSDEKLQQLEFNEEEIADFKNVLQEAGLINHTGLLNIDDVEYFTLPNNAADFSVPGFEDYDKDVFFIFYDIAQSIQRTLSDIEEAVKAVVDVQASAILEQVQNTFAIDRDAVSLLTRALFNVNDNIHEPWVLPLLDEANALNRLETLPQDMDYAQTVKRVGQLALLINHLQLDKNEIAIALNDQKLAAKFPEDMILPESITHIDAVLETGEFVYLFNGENYWIYQASDYTLIDKKSVVAGNTEDDKLIDLQKDDETLQKRLKEDPIRQLFAEEGLSKVNAAFIDSYGTWCIISGDVHYIRYAEQDSWDRRDNHFGQVDNEFDNIEMIDSAYVNPEGVLYLFCNDKYIRYSNTDFILDPSAQANATQPTVDPGYPKSIAEDWADEHQAIQLPAHFQRDLGPLFDGLDDNSYAFKGNQFVSSDDSQLRSVADQWGHVEHSFSHTDYIDAAMASEGQYWFFLEDKVVSYAGSIELANLQPEDGFPKPIEQVFSNLPHPFARGISAALPGLDGQVHLFSDDDCVTASFDAQTATYTVNSSDVKTQSRWGIIDNPVADSGQVDAAFVGLDGKTYLFSGSQYIRYSTADYSQVDDGFPRVISEDWEGLTEVTGAFVLGNKTYLFGANSAGDAVYVRYSTVHKKDDELLEFDEKDPNARTIETVLANRPDVEDIEVFPAVVDAEFWSLPRNLIPDTIAPEDFQIDAVMNGPEGKVFLFYGDYVIEHDHASRWWSEPELIRERWNRIPAALSSTTIGENEQEVTINQSVSAALMGEDGYSYLFFDTLFLRFSDQALRRIDNGFPRKTEKVWGRVKNNIETTGEVDAALVVESRWEEQDDNGQLTDMTAMHTYLFSGDQFYRYLGSDYTTVEPGYPRDMSRLKDEPRFKGVEDDSLDSRLANGLNTAFADQRQVYLFVQNHFYTVNGDEYKDQSYRDAAFADVQAVTQQAGATYTLDSSGTWYKHNHLDDVTPVKTAATPRIAEMAQEKLSSSISAVLHGTNGKSYVFGGTECYDAALESQFNTVDLWGRSRNPIQDKEMIDAAFVGRDGVTYVFSGRWFVEYAAQNVADHGYLDQTVTYPPRRISDKWHGLSNVALAYVWKEETYLFEKPDSNGNFRYVRYSKDSYEKPDAGFPRWADQSLWDIPEAYLREGFANIDSIFVHEDNLIFLADQHFISFNLRDQIWSVPRPLELLYEGIPFNQTDFQHLSSGFQGADEKVYFFNQQRFVSFDPNEEPEDAWSDILNIKDHWGLQKNIFEQGVDAAYVGSDGATYLFAGQEYVKYSGSDYRYVDENYPKAIATYLRDEPAFAFMEKTFQQHLDDLEAAGTVPVFKGLVTNGRNLYLFTQDTASNGVLFAGSENAIAEYVIDGLGQLDNNFTSGQVIDAAFVDVENEKTYLFSGEQYIRYTGDSYRYVDAGYPKVIAESFAEEDGLNFESLHTDIAAEEYRNGIDAAFYVSSVGAILLNERNYLYANNGTSTEGEIANVWGQIDNAFLSSVDSTIDGGFIDEDGALLLFKNQHFIRYSDTAELFALNPYAEARYVDAEYPQRIDEQWPHLSDSILTDDGVTSVFQLENQIYFHTGEFFSVYDSDQTDVDDVAPVQVLAYRWGEWSDYLLTDIHAISRFKGLNERFSGGNISLTELVSGANGNVYEPYMEFAAIFGFEKEEVRWLKQRNAFLPTRSNVMEEDFQVELALKLYDVLSATQRMGVEVAPLYNNAWTNLYVKSDTLNLPNYSAAATGLYDLLVSVDCDNNYKVLVKQIHNELNTVKRNALVPYVIANDPEVTTTRELYQKLLIDTQMDSCAETSRIKEAIAAVQLYLHRYFVNLENVELASEDQEAARAELKERWEWLKNYRVWEANRKVFLYPENYLRPELRDSDAKSRGFEALEESLTQGELTENAIEEAYFKYLDAFTEVSELTLAGGYVYDDGVDKKVLVLGRTRTAPMRYFYRFGTFVNGSSDANVWEPWVELDIPIEAVRVEPVYAFNRVFIFWSTVEETVEDASAADITVKESNGTQTVNSSGNSTYEVKVFYSFYNLNKRWTQPQLLQTEFDGVSQLKSSERFPDNIELFVENSAKLTHNDEEHDYENIYICARSLAGTVSTQTGNIDVHSYAAYRLTPELYSQPADIQPVENRGVDLFNELFPQEGGIEDDNVVMLNYTANSVDGPWFAYNHNGAGFMVKPDAVAASSELALSDLSGASDYIYTASGIGAAVQMATDGEVVFFLEDGTFVTRTIGSSQEIIFSDPKAINSEWGISNKAIEVPAHIDAAFVLGEQVYFTLADGVFEYSFTSGLAGNIDLDSGLNKQRVALSDLPVADASLIASWDAIGAGITSSDTTLLFQQNGTGVYIENSNTSSVSVQTLKQSYGLNAGAMTFYNGKLHVINGNQYSILGSDGSISTSNDISVQAVVSTLFGARIFNNVFSNMSTKALMTATNGLCVCAEASDGSLTNFLFDNNGNYLGTGMPTEFGQFNNDNWVAGAVYTDNNSVRYDVAFYLDNHGNSSLLKSIGGAAPEAAALSGVKITGAFVDDSNQVFVVIDNYWVKNITAYLAGTPADLMASLSSALEPITNYGFTVENEGYNTIGTSESGIDAAFIGDGVYGTQADALYLFMGESYYRFSSIGNGEYRSIADVGYPKTLAANTEGLPQWTQVDAAFISPATTGSKAYFFNNDAANDYSNPSYIYSGQTELIPMEVATTTVLATYAVVDAAYVAGNTLYLISGNQYYAYSVSNGVANRTALSGFPQALPDTVMDNAQIVSDVLGDLDLSFDNIKNNWSRISTTLTVAVNTLAGESTRTTIDAAVTLGDYVYLFSGDQYYRLDVNNADPKNLTSAATIKGSWGNLPETVRANGLDAAFQYVETDGNGKTSVNKLFFIQSGQFIDYDFISEEVTPPYELNSVDYEVIRLTSSTAEKLNQVLFAKGIDGLLQMATQEINESPTISFDASTPENIQMNSARFSKEPTNSHLDFSSANGLYYWEVFFHTPFLIAQALNTDQKFEEAKTWYEYIFDPTEVAGYWKFLPFLAADPKALTDSLLSDIDLITSVALLDDVVEKDAVTGENITVEDKITAVTAAVSTVASALTPYQKVFLGQRDKQLYEKDEYGSDVYEKYEKPDDYTEATLPDTLTYPILANIEIWPIFRDMVTKIASLSDISVTNKTLLTSTIAEMQEVVAILENLDTRIDLMDNYQSQLQVYLDDPFDPHAIAGLRPLAYRKAIVMRYVDNLLDWGDLLFRQYTRESINEARMLYILAHDILGERPENMGRVVLEPTQSYSEFEFYTGDDNEAYNFLIDLENETVGNTDEVIYEQSLSFAASQFDTITAPYFFLKENELFTEYWTRVEDRLGKIRACLNIDGVAQPLPLFQPPIDPMALVNAAASGGGASAAAMAAVMTTVPDYRFNTQIQRSKDLTGKLKGFSDSLLSTLEKKDAEQLSLLESKQQAEMLELTSLLKEEAILEAEDSLNNLIETRRRADEQRKHYVKLIDDGYLPEEATQIAMMSAATVLHGVTALGKYVAGLSYIVPQFTAGPFSFGVTAGGENVGAMMGQFGEAVQSGAEALSMGGEVAGVAGQFKRSAQDWELQRMMAESEVTQLDLQISAQEHRLLMTKQELVMHKKDVQHRESISEFMKNKFSNAQLYSWISGKLSGLFYQTYKLAHDYAKQAEQAFVFEKGLQPGKVNYVNGMYWDSQKKGLMSGESLELDLDKMEKAYRDTDPRCLEITKNISLLELDPLALLELKKTGACTFRLTEALFDYDFPGHFNRQIKSVSLAFDIGEGQQVNATLTQLSSHQVMDTDVKAVKHLLDPNSPTTPSIRTNWRANQQVALSHVDQYTENSGMFELNFGDERYLPFEGTGAISNWRLELKGSKGSYNPAELLDVTMKLRYTAKSGGSRFENEVKGLLKPYHATSFFDLAYNFPDEWAALTNGDVNGLDITFTRDMFPNMSSSKIIGAYVRYEYEEGNGGAVLVMNNDLTLPGDTYLQPNTLSVGQNGSAWNLAVKGDPSTLKNAELVLVYKAKL